MKTYNQFCGTALALDQLGDRWTLLILRDLLLGPRRYSDLLNSLQGITTNLLAARLAKLSADGLIEKSEAAPYRLTARGQAVEPIIMALADFGIEAMKFPPPETSRVDPRWMVLNLKRRYQGGWSGAFSLQIASLTVDISDVGNGLTIVESIEAPILMKLTLFQAARWIIQGKKLESLDLEVNQVCATALESATSLQHRLRRP